MASNSTVPFPLGAMIGGPNGSDPAAEAKIAAQYQRFVDLMGAKPQFMNSFVDQGQPIKDWPGNASWTAWSWRQSSVAQNVIPVIGLPMATSADSGRRSAVFKEFAAGQHDAALRGIVEAWKGQGYETLYIRPGYEMNGDFVPWYAGSDAATRAEWVAAFRHIADVVRHVPGVDVKVVWNPNIQAGNTADVKGLYPGDSFVDVIAGDIYSPIYPRDLYSWSRNDGTVDATFAEWVSDPVNRTHYWDYPAANQWNPISDGQSNTFSLRDLLAFAKAHGKPVAIAETGAGGDGSRGPMDDPAFPKWLASTLREAGVPVAFVNIWDLDPGDGNWDFTSPGANKPLTAAAWAKEFGMPLPVKLPNAIGDGPDVIVLQLSEDACDGHAQFTVAVDGRQVGGAQTVTASHAAGQSQVLNIQGTFGTGAHTVSVTFLNDYYKGAGADRNLHVDSVGYRGLVAETRAPLFSAGTRSFAVPAAAAAPPDDTLVLHLSQDRYGDPAQFSVRLDGVQIGSPQAVLAVHGKEQPQTFTFKGQFGPGAHKLGVSFLNDAYGGSAATDRNLHIDAVEFNGRPVPNATLTLTSNGAVNVAIPTLAARVPDTIVFNLSEDAWSGDAQCLLTLDGQQLGGVQTVTASHALGVPQRMAFSGDFGPGPHTASVQFLNDAWGGRPDADRNLFLQSAEFNGQAVPGSTRALYSNGSTTFDIPGVQAQAATATLLDPAQASIPPLLGA